MSYQSRPITFDYQDRMFPVGWRRRWFVMGRIFWLVITLLSLGLFFTGIPGRFEQLASTVDQRSLLEFGLSAGAYATYIIGLSFMVILAHIIIAAVIFWRKPDDWMALFVSFTLVTNGALVPLSLMNIPDSVPPLWSFLAAIVTYSGLVSSITILYLFPDGRFTPRWTALLTITWAGLVFAAIFLPRSPFSFTTWPLLFQTLLLLIWPGAGVFAQIYRFEHVSNPIQRQQTKWALLGLMAAVLGPFSYFLPFVILPSITGPVIPNVLYQRVGSSFFTFSFMIRLSGLTIVAFTLLLFPLLFAIAILRYRLWDIDIFIRRTLIYGPLTATLLLVYSAGVVLFQAIFNILTGQSSDLAIVASTLGLAALFNPLRQRVQNFIDLRCYRRKYDTEKTLMAFSAMMRAEVDLDKLTTELVRVVEETMQPAQVSLWLRKPDS